VDAEFDHLAGTFHKYIEVFRLGVATAQAGHGGDVIALFVSLNDDGEFSLRLLEYLCRSDPVTELLGYPRL
jgi:hypothetical protein